MADKTLTSGAYVLGITKDTVLSSIYKMFYNRLQRVEDPKSINRAKYIYPAFPANLVDNSDSYPLLVLNSAEISWDKFTLTKKWVMATINIDVFTTKTEELDTLSDSVLTAIEGSYTAFNGVQLRYVQLSGTTTDHIIRDQITIHNKTLTFTCQWSFERSL